MQKTLREIESIRSARRDGELAVYRDFLACHEMSDEAKCQMTVAWFRREKKSEGRFVITNPRTFRDLGVKI